MVNSSDSYSSRSPHRNKQITGDGLAKAFEVLETRSQPPSAANDTIDQGVIETTELGPLAKLPPFRPVVIALIRVLDQPDADMSAVSRLAESDPAVVSELLALVNSSLFGISGTVASAGHAISMLGLDRTRSLVSILAMRSMMANAPQTPVIRRFWMHSLATATIAQCLAPQFGVSAGLAHVAGIMHDLGRIGLLAAHANRYSRFALTSHDNVAAILAAEQAGFGMDHCHAGIRLARAWGLPVALRGAIEHHHEPPTGSRGMECLLQLACRLADSLLFQAVHHRDAAKPHETVASSAPEDLKDLVTRQLVSMQNHVLDSIQSLDY